LVLISLYLVSDGVGIATGCGQDNRGAGVRVPVGSRIICASARPALGSTQPPIQWVQGVLSPGVKWQGCEADCSPPASSKVKKISHACRNIV
jgi:hypothetical protein